ncbi:MAG: hypothetical protein NTZ05_10560, partial [Chloroflexi bacterium]|nr:hypothetical protein [Chloroflexota bacterium]
MSTEINEISQTDTVRHLGPVQKRPRAFAKYKAYVSGTRWELAISGRWSESPYHSGHIAYYVRRIAGGVW